jgi:hypothetical protein
MINIERKFTLMGTTSVAIGASSPCQQVFGLLAGLSEVILSQILQFFSYFVHLG